MDAEVLSPAIDCSLEASRRRGWRHWQTVDWSLCFDGLVECLFLKELIKVCYQFTKISLRRRSCYQRNMALAHWRFWSLSLSRLLSLGQTLLAANDRQVTLVFSIWLLLLTASTIVWYFGDCSSALLLVRIRSFLTDRTFQVAYNGELSSVSVASFGVPQETVLSPLLFIFIICSQAEQVGQ